MNDPEIRYVDSGGVSIAYSVLGDGPHDLVVVQGYMTNLYLNMEPPLRDAFERMASFARVITFDKRGTGLSDPVDDPPILEQRMEDVRAVMDAAGSERAVLFGISEGSQMCILFAASYPERVESLVLYGAMARTSEAPGYPWAPPAEAQAEASLDLIGPDWGTGATIEIFAPSVSEDPRWRSWMAKIERMGASPKMAQKLFSMFIDVDVRHVLPVINVPTLVLHRRGDRVVNVRAGRWLAEQIQGAKLVELSGTDHMFAEAQDILDEVEHFVTGAAPVLEPDRVLATVLFTDIVDSTKLAAAQGDKRWRDTLDALDALVDEQVTRSRGRVIKGTGDGHLATFDAPGAAIRAANAMRANARSRLGLELRAGVHTGEIERRGDDISGLAVIIARRVCDIGKDPGLLVSASVPALVAGSGIQFAERGTHELKGVPGQWILYEVVS